MEVPAPLTSLSSLAPRPQNISAEAPEPQKLSTFLKPKGGYARWVLVKILALPRLGMSLVEGLYTWAVGTPVPLPPPATNSTDDAEAGSAAADHEAGANSTSTSVTTAAPFRRMEDIPQDHWDAHIMPYLEPQHITVRTSQLAGVGFPVDHKALLWCHQVVQTTTRLMARLARVPTNVTLSGAELSSVVVKMKSQYALPSWPAPAEGAAAGAEAGSCAQDESESGTPLESCSAPVSPIPAVQEELLRNASKHLFSRIALDDERRYFLDLLTSTRADAPGNRGILENLFGSLSVMSLALVTAHLTTVLTCYVAIALLVMATFVLHFISVKNKWSVPRTCTPLYSSQDFASEAALFLPENHLFLGSFDDFNAAVLPSFWGSRFVRGKERESSGVSAGAIVVVLGGVLAHMTLSSQNPTDFLRNNGLVVQWVVSYGSALGLHLVVLAAVHGIRCVVNTTFSVARLALRCTVWCKPVRQFLRPRLRGVNNAMQEMYAAVPAVEWVALVLVMSALVAGTVVFDQQASRLMVDADAGASAAGFMPYAGRLVQMAALLFLLSYSFFLLVLVAALVWPRAGASRLLTPAIALCLPGNTTTWLS
jgi:hypothetical protein